MNNDNPTLFDAIISQIEKRILAMFGPTPGRITAYDSATQKASVQPLIYRARTAEGGERVAERVSIVHNVPVVFPGGGTYRLTVPLVVGDTVLLVFADSSLDRWLQRGGEVDPEDDRRFDVNDAVAFPGMHHFGNPPTTAPTDAMVLHGDMIKLGSPSAFARVALGTDLDALKSAIASSLTGATAGDLLISIKAVFAAWAATGATKVKAI